VVRLSSVATVLPEKELELGAWLGAGAGLDVLERR